MRLTPLDIRNHSFARRLGGYDQSEVESFLRLVAEDYEDLVREADALRDKTARLETRVTDLAANEAVLQETLTTAQRLSEDLKQTAVKEAELVLGEAEIRAEKLVDAAHRRAAKLAAEIRELKLLRSRVAAAVKAVIETHLGLLEELAREEPEDPAVERKLAVLAPAGPAAGEGPG